MDKETSCLSCHGTGMICAPFDSRPGYPAHPYKIVCGCGIMIDKLAFLDCERGGTVPGTTHRQVLARAMGWVALVDELLKADIEALWEAGITTWSSCQDNPGKWIAIGSQVSEALQILPWVTNVEDHPVPAYPGAKVLCERVRS